MPARGDFVAKTLADVTEAIERTVFATRYARIPGLLQNLDPRVKVITFLVLLLVTAMTHRLEILVGLYLLTLLLALAAKIPLGFFVKRVWVFIPLFAGAIALPTILNVITPGRPVVTLISFSYSQQWGPIHLPAAIAITEQGLRGAAIFVLRVATSVSFAVLLVLTTEWMRLLKALSALHFPQVGILILGMTYRYIFLFLRVVEGMFLARRSRTLGPTPLREQHHWIAARLGFLLGKSYHLSNEVYLAMLSRGWNGQARSLDDFRPSTPLALRSGRYPLTGGVPQGDAARSLVKPQRPSTPLALRSGQRLRWMDAAWSGFVLGVVLLISLWEIVWK